MTAIVLWHGGRRWNGPPEVGPCAKGRHEHGPGIYATTSMDTASKYSKGGGVVTKLEIDPTAGWLEGARLKASEMEGFVKGLAGLRKRGAVLDDLKRCCSRHEDGMAPAAYLVNLLVNHEALVASHGPIVARFLAERGIDLSLAKNDAGEQWVVIFNPEKILKATPVSKSDIGGDQWNLPRIDKKTRL